MKPICRETLERAYLFLDGEGLSDEDREQIERHLEDCGPCYERYGLEREVHKVVARLKGADPCPARLKNKIANLLQTY